MRKVTKVTTKPKMKQNNTQKLSNVINLNNPFLQSDPELMKLLKEILVILNKKRKYKRKLQQSKLIQGNTLGMKSNKIESTVSSEPVDVPRYQPPQISILGGNHDNNRYRQLEYEIKDLTKTINDQNRNNMRPMLENKHELPINFTHADDSAFELVKRVAKYRDQDAAKELVKQVPEFKGMMSDLAELGASSARMYLDEVNKDISILEKNKYELENKNEKLNDEIEQLNDKVQTIELNRNQVEDRLNELQDSLQSKEYEYNQLNYTNEQIQRANEKLNLQIDKNKEQLQGIELVHQETLKNLNKAIDSEIEMKEKLQLLEDTLRQKENELKEVEIMKEQAELKAEEEYTIRKKVERSKSKSDIDRRKISKDVIQLKNKETREKVVNSRSPAYRGINAYYWYLKEQTKEVNKLTRQQRQLQNKQIEESKEKMNNVLTQLKINTNAKETINRFFSKIINKRREDRVNANIVLNETTRTANNGEVVNITLYLTPLELDITNEPSMLVIVGKITEAINSVFERYEADLTVIKLRINMGDQFRTIRIDRNDIVNDRIEVIANNIIHTIIDYMNEYNSDINANESIVLNNIMIGVLFQDRRGGCNDASMDHSELIEIKNINGITGLGGYTGCRFMYKVTNHKSKNNNCGISCLLKCAGINGNKVKADSLRRKYNIEFNEMLTPQQLGIIANDTQIKINLIVVNASGFVLFNSNTTAIDTLSYEIILFSCWYLYEKILFFLEGMN